MTDQLITPLMTNFGFGTGFNLMMVGKKIRRPGWEAGRCLWLGQSAVIWVSTGTWAAAWIPTTAEDCEAYDWCEFEPEPAVDPQGQPEAATDAG